MKNLPAALVPLVILFVIGLSHAAFADSYSDAVDVFKKSGIAGPFFKKSYGYAVFPTVGKGGIGIGGAYGEGRVYAKGKMTGTVTLAKLSIGFQLGGQAFSEIIFFQDQRAYSEFTGGNFEFDASASTVAITAGAQAFGSQCIVLGMDVKKVKASTAIPSGYEIVINGGRTHMGIDALWWAQEAVRLGAGEICLNSIDADGTQAGYELNLTRMISEAVPIPVIASGGAGTPEHLRQVLTQGRADAALIASMVHYGTYTIQGIKDYLAQRHIPVRLIW